MWIYIPTSHSTQELEDWTLDIEEVTQELSRSYTWKEILKPPQFWLKKYEQVDWIKHLFGAIPPPSIANHLLEKWMQSLEDSHVNHLVEQEEEREQKTKDGYGKTSLDWLARYDQENCFWRTSQDSFLEVSKLSLEDFPRWGMMQNGLLYKLKKLEHLIREKEYLSWPTPDTMPEAPNSSANVKERPASLGKAAELWQTPTTSGYITRSDGTVLLPGQALMWKTPLAADGIKGKTGLTKTGQGKGLTDQVEDQWNFPQDLTIQDGHRLLKKDQTLHPESRLNPKFVEWLMGWEENWLEVLS